MTVSSPPALTRGHALFLDFDGTLAPLQDDPDAVRLTDGQRAKLARLADMLEGAVGVVTGRDVRDISSRVPMELWRAGNHGAAISAPGEHPSDLPEAPAALRQITDEVVGQHGRELWIEDKGPVLAVHFRKRPDLGDTLKRELSTALQGFDTYKVERGNGVVELKPAAANKGRAIEALMERSPFVSRRPLFIGDDTTDEDGFAAAIALGGEAIKVGPGETKAPFRLEDCTSVWRYLEDGFAAIS